MRLLSAFLALSVPAALWADTTITAQYTAGGQTSETTVFTKGVRQRFETRGGGVLILQPDQQRMLQVNTKDNTYKAVPLIPAAGGTARKGGTVTYSTTVTDTGETKDVFGLTAKHIKTVMVKEASADACDPKGQKVETDGWYVDLPVPVSADTERAAGCIDEVKFIQNGAPAQSLATLGYPVQYTMTTVMANEKPLAVTMKVTTLDQNALAASLFEAPAGAQDAKSQEVKAPSVAAAKVAGTTRVGVVLPKDKTLSLRTPINFQDQLMGSLAQSDVDAVPLVADDAEQARARAKEMQCDYVLYSEVAEIKKPAPSKIGGLLKKIPVNSGTQEAAEAKVAYQLLPVDGGQPKASADAVGKTGGFTWRNAVQVTTTVGMFAMSRYMMLNPAMAGMFFHMQGSMGANPVQMFDPMMGNLLSLTSHGQQKADASSEAAATTAAMQQVAKGVLTALGKS